MTKKDYELIARVMEYNMPSKIAKPKGYSDRLEAWTNILNGLIEAFEQSNTKFNRDKFLQACGVNKSH